MKANAGVLTTACWVLVALTVSASAEDAPCPEGATLRNEERQDGRIEMCVDADGKLDGPARVFEQGVLRREDVWRHGLQHGRSLVYDDNGVRREERSYENGQLAGTEMYFHANGRAQSTTHYAAGKKHGPIGEWDAGGTQLVDGAFADDAPVGIWLGAEAGKPLTAIVHTDGRRAAALALEAGCAAWNAAAPGTRTQFAADFSLVIFAEFEKDPVAPIGEVDRFVAARCIVSDLAPVEAAMSWTCNANPASRPLGAATSAAVAERLASCMLSARKGAQ
jgi:hypothetical protein